MGLNDASFPDEIVVTLGSKWNGTNGLDPTDEVILQVESLIAGSKKTYTEDGTLTANDTSNRIKYIAWDNAPQVIQHIHCAYGSAWHARVIKTMSTGALPTYTFLDIFNATTGASSSWLNMTALFTSASPVMKSDVFSAMAEYIPAPWVQSALPYDLTVTLAARVKTYRRDEDLPYDEISEGAVADLRTITYRRGHAGV